MRNLWLFGLLAILSSPAIGQTYDRPEALVTAIYETYQAGRPPADPGMFYSDRLLQLFADHAERAAERAEVESAVIVAETSDGLGDGFNPFVDGQNALLLDVAIGTPLVIDDRALVTVGFHNFDQPTLLSLALVRQADGWKVDDVTSTGGEENWMLSWLLQYDPWGL